MIRTTLAALTACAALAAPTLALAQTAEPAACRKISFSDVGWTDITATTALTTTVLDALGPTLVALRNQVRVEGHANSLPVTPGGVWPSNWELSAVRATTVLRHLSESDGVPETRLSAAGYSSTRPLVPDTDPEHVTANRRVDLVVVSTASPEANQLLPGLEAAAVAAAAGAAAGPVAALPAGTVPPATSPPGTVPPATVPPATVPPATGPAAEAAAAPEGSNP